MSVRGYAAWKPKAEAIHWVRATREVVDAYRDYWPLSVRQIFYRLVADHQYEKTEAAYMKLTQILSRARRAGYLPWDAIRDGGLGRSVPARYFADQQNFEDTILRAAKTMKLNRQRDQDMVIELWCEAGGMVPILEGIAAPYSCVVNTGGGYDSVTAKHRLAERVRERAETTGLKTLILHVGDFDASGEDMANVLRDDTLHMVATQVLQSVGRYANDDDRDNELWREAPWTWLEAEALSGDWSTRAVRWAVDFFDVQRVALTGEQVVERQVETAPAKPKDSRTAEFVRRNQWVVDELGTDNITAQLEALTPPELTDVISGAIEAHLDMDLHQTVCDDEQEIRTTLVAKLDGGDNDKGANDAGR